MISSFFDADKRYKEVIFQEGQFIASEDFNLVQDLDNHDKRELFKYLEGFQLKINALVNSPVLKVRANNDLVEGQVIEIEVVDASNVRWRSNGGAWSGSIAVTFNNVTWNTIGTSGLDAVLKSSPTAADLSEVWVSQAMRLLGGAIDSTAPGTFRLTEGKWSILGEFEAFDAPLSAVGCANDDYLFLQVTKAVIDYTADNTLGHRLADGNYSEKSPEAVQRQYALLSGATVPANTLDPYVQNIIVGKVVNAAGGTFLEMWDAPFDVQQFLRIYGNTVAPVAPTGLTLTTGSDVNLVDGALMANRVSLPTPSLGYVTMSCNPNDEADIDYYEFKITRLASVGGALTADSIVQLVKNNTDAGGGMAVPLGISYTLHGQQFGVPYRVWVRAVDLAGNVGSWSASSDVVVGGSTSEIPALDAGPTFTLIDTEGFVGVTISVTGVPALATGYSVWIGEGAYPNVAINEGFIGSYNANVGLVNIPWKENGRPYVRIKAFDQNGIYQALTSESNVHLATSAQLATNSHNESLASHGGVISDILTCQGPHGSVYRWLNLLSGQAWSPGNVYIVATSGSSYQSIQGALDAIHLERPEKALILVAPGETADSGTIVFPDFADGGSFTATPVTIQGLGKHMSHITAPIDVSSVLATQNDALYGYPSSTAGLTFKDITLLNKIRGVKTTSTVGSIVFDSCCVVGAINTEGLVYLDGGASAGILMVYAHQTDFNNSGTAPTLLFEREVNFVLQSCKIRQRDMAGDKHAVSLSDPAGSYLVVKDCMVEARNGHVGANTGRWIYSSAAYNVTAHGNFTNTAPHVNVTLDEGSVSTNSVLAAEFFV